MAAAALLLVLRPVHDVTPYDLLLTGSVAETRGQSQAPGELVRVTPQSELELVLRPAQRVHGDVVLSVYLYSSQGSFALKKPAERDQSGALRVVGSVQRLFEAPFGSYTLAAVVDRKAHTAEEVAHKLETRAEGVESVRLEFAAAR